jgi:hypothetical protein
LVILKAIFNFGNHMMGSYIMVVIFFNLIKSDYGNKKTPFRIIPFFISTSRFQFRILLFVIVLQKDTFFNLLPII